MFSGVISRINVLFWIKNLLEDRWTGVEEQGIKQAWLNVFACQNLMSFLETWLENKISAHFNLNISVQWR